MLCAISFEYATSQKRLSTGKERFLESMELYKFVVFLAVSSPSTDSSDSIRWKPFARPFGQCEVLHHVCLWQRMASHHGSSKLQKPEQMCVKNLVGSHSGYL